MPVRLAAILATLAMPAAASAAAPHDRATTSAASAPDPRPAVAARVDPAPVRSPAPRPSPGGQGAGQGGGQNGSGPPPGAGPPPGSGGPPAGHVPPGQVGRDTPPPGLTPAVPAGGAPAAAPVAGASAAAAAASPPPPLEPLPAGAPTPTPAPAAGTPGATSAPRSQRRAARRRSRTAPPAASSALEPAAAPVPALAPAPPAVAIEPARRTRRAARDEQPKREKGFVVFRRIQDLVDVIPYWVWWALAGLAALALLLGAGVVVAALRARRAERQRERLAHEVELLEAAVVPEVPQRVGALWTSVAHVAADGPAAGGDFYDVFPLDGTRAGLIVGDVMGHGGDALMRTTLLRHTLRAYVEAGLSPREAIKMTDRVLADQLGGTFATAVVAVHDGLAGTLSYACAGHPPPVLLGRAQHVPVLQGAAAPMGVGAVTGVRETTVSFAAGSLACFYTDGLVEARAREGLLGYERLTEVVDDLGPAATAGRVLDAVADATDHVPDDMAVCVLRPADGLIRPRLRVEELELTPEEVDAGGTSSFVRACGLGEFSVERAESLARRTVHKFGGTSGVVVRVRLSGFRPGVDILPARGEEPHPAGLPALAGTRV